MPDNPPSIEGMAQKIHLDPIAVKKHFDRIDHFRILVVGRSSAGKTTLLQRVCNTMEAPEIYNSRGEKVKYLVVQRHRLLMHGNSQLDPKIVQGSLEASWKLDWWYGYTDQYFQRGEHNIEDELIFPSNPGFIFHDSRGFEGGTFELDLLKHFLVRRAYEMKLERRLHAIWYDQTIPE